MLTTEDAEAARGRVVSPPVETEIADSGYRLPYQSLVCLWDQYPKYRWEHADGAEGFEAVAGVGELSFFDRDTKLEVFDQGPLDPGLDDQL